MKKLLCSLLCLVLIVSLAACRSESELKQEAAWKDMANDVMVDFLKEKYDLNVTLTNLSVCVNRSSGYVPIASAPLIPYVTAQFEHNDKEYYVCVNLTNESNPICYDNFQEEEITQILVDHINKIVGSEAIAWYNRTFDVFENISHVEDGLNVSESRLMNKKIEKFDDIITNYQQNLDQKDYTLSDITIYYHNAAPFNFSDENIQDMLKMTNITIVNLSSTETAYKYNGQAAGIDLFRDEIIEYVSIGCQVSHFVEGGEVLAYDLNNAIVVDDMLFCSVTDDVAPKTTDVSDETAVTKACTIGNYTCIIPVSYLGNSFVQSFEGVFLVDGEVVETIRGYYCLDTFHKDGEQYFIFNCANADYAEYDTWYLREIIEVDESEELS